MIDKQKSENQAKTTGSLPGSQKSTGTLTGQLNRRRPRWLMILGILGPGMVAASAGNDAGGIYTYSSMGSQFGYSMLWVMVVLTFGLAMVQEMCTRMGAVTGKGLSDLIRENFPIRLTMLVMLAFLLQIAASLSLNLSGLPPLCKFLAYLPGSVCQLPVFPMVVGCAWFVCSRRKSVSGAVSGIPGLFYCCFSGQTSWSQVMIGAFVPTIQFNSNYLLMLIACVGTTISPFMQIYVQSSVVERGVSVRDYNHERIDVYSAAIFLKYGLCLYYYCHSRYPLAASSGKGYL